MASHFEEYEWKPQIIRRQINAVKSSTLVVEVETDQGSAFLKGLSNPQGNESLAFELVGTRLARAIGLATPDYSVLDHDFLPLERFDHNPVPFGPVFVSKAVQGSTGAPKTAFLKSLSNPESIPLLVAFDTWVTNFDRCPPNNYINPTPNWDNVFFVQVGRRYQLTVFDHTHCFAEDQLEFALQDNGFRDDRRVFGKFLEFEPFLSEASVRKAIQPILHLDVAKIEQIVEGVPNEWQVTNADRERWVQQLDQRRDELEDILLDDLSAQMRLTI